MLGVYPTKIWNSHLKYLEYLMSQVAFKLIFLKKLSKWNNSNSFRASASLIWTSWLKQSEWKERNTRASSQRQCKYCVSSQPEAVQIFWLWCVCSRPEAVQIFWLGFVCNQPEAVQIFSLRVCVEASRGRVDILSWGVCSQSEAMWIFSLGVCATGWKRDNFWMKRTKQLH